MYRLTDMDQEYIINAKTLNKIIKLLEDKPFKIVIELLNEIKTVSIDQNSIENENCLTNNEVKNANNN